MSRSNLDIEAARKLAAEISASLDALPAGDARHAELRAEVTKLRSMLAGADTAPPELESSMRSVHSSLDRAAAELRADGVRAGLFLQELGRILGLD
jgi:hypothetical protein